MDSRLIATHLCYRAGQRQLINDVSLVLSPGEVVALIGPNGAGKSTLLRLLTGYLTPHGGECRLNDIPLAAWPAQALSERRAMMRQQSRLGFDWPVEEVIAMGRAPWHDVNNPSIVQEIMALTGCLPLAKRQYNALSGGEQQRVQLARALAQLWQNGAPEGFLFLDEPTSALDLYHQQHLLRLLKSLARQHALHVCVVLHDLNLAALWADRLVLLHQGEVVAQGAAGEVLHPAELHRWYGADVTVGTHPGTATPQVFLTP